MVLLVVVVVALGIAVVVCIVLDYSFEYLCFIGVLLDLELVSVRSAPGIVVKQPALYRSDVVSVEVLEPQDPPLPTLALPPPASAKPYRIPRIPLSAPAPIKKKVHRLSK